MKMRKIIAFTLILLSSLLMLMSCMSESATDMGAGGAYGGGMGSVAPGYTNKSESAADPDASEGSAPDQITLPAGQMTAGAWSDNDNYDKWTALFAQGEETNGKFYQFSGSDSWGFSSLYRVKVNVMCDDKPVAGAPVTATAEDGTPVFRAVTDAAGNAYIFTSEPSGRVSVNASGDSVMGVFSAEKRDISLTISGNTDKKNMMEIMFVIDVTGSMGDELEYVEAEISDVISRVSAENDGAVINMALLFYRDNGDKEKFAYHDFTCVTEEKGLSKLLGIIKEQYATGGGDYAEAVDEALAMAVSKQWSDGDVTKLIFHILDAPPHEAKANKDTYRSAVTKAAEMGIRICPILCSGADTLTEYVSREAAICTGGTFIFVTDDSGIGGSHHDPALPDVTVELLNSLLVRVINGHHTGVFAEPIDWRQEIRPEQ